MTYYIFAGNDYYPAGGVEDFKGLARGRGEAKAIIKKLRSTANGNYQSTINWFQVANDKMEIVFEGRVDCKTGEIRKIYN